MIRSERMILILLASILVVLAHTSVQAQGCSFCGDLNDNGSVSSTDYDYLRDWLYMLEPPPGDLACASIDGYPGITLQDLFLMYRYIYISGPALFCDTVGEGYVPAASDNYAIYHNTLFPAGASTVVLRIGLETAVSLPFARGMTAPLEIRVDGEIPEVSNLEFSDQAHYWWSPTHQAGPYSAKGRVNPAGGSEGQVLMGMNVVSTELPADRYKLARVELTLPPAPVDREITVGWFDLPLGNLPMIGGDFEFGGCYTMDFAPCDLLVEVSGDTNSDGVVNSSDVIYLVSFALKGGPQPEPVWQSGDTNCDGRVTSADILRLVDYVFKGGLSLCDVCVPLVR